MKKRFDQGERHPPDFYLKVGAVTRTRVGWEFMIPEHVALTGHVRRVLAT
jgi:hypothetical protein